jgi:hypothetical protein
MAEARLARTGVAAIAAGALLFVAQAGELVFESPEELFAAIGGLGIAALAVAVWGLRPVASGRAGRIGWRTMAVGAIFLGLFAIQMVITVAVTGEVTGTFILFALGFLLLFVGHLVIAPGLRPTLGRLWVLPLVAAAGIVVAITVPWDPIHDGGLFVFEGAWVAFGIGLVRSVEPAPKRVAVSL